jgi:Ni/Co efflux regulator RcnB
VPPRAQPPAPAPQAAAQVLGNRDDPRGQAVASAAPTAARLASNPPGPRSYFSSKDQELVRRYYEAHPVVAHPAKWKAGEPIPAGVALTGVPDDVRAALPLLMPGYQYVQVDGEVVLVAVQSRTVLDGVSRTMR